MKKTVIRDGSSRGLACFILEKAPRKNPNAGGQRALGWCFRQRDTDWRDTLVILNLHDRDVGGASEGSLGSARQYKLSLRGCAS